MTAGASSAAAATGAAAQAGADGTTSVAAEAAAAAAATPDLAGAAASSVAASAVASDAGAPEEIGDIRLGDIVLLLNLLPKYLRAMSLSVRSVYAAKTKFVSSFTKLQEELSNEASVLRTFLLPLCIELIVQLTKFLNHYLENDVDVWMRQIDVSARGAKEYQTLWLCTAEFFEHLSGDLQRFPPLVQAVRDALVQETMKFQREAGVLSIKSLVEDDVFISLLFVPDVDYYAAPLVHGGQKHDFTKPVVAKDQFERALASACTVEETLMPAVEKYARLCRELAGFFGELLACLEGQLGASSDPPPPPKKRDPWANFGKSSEELEAERRKEEEEETAANAGRVPTDPEEAARLEANRRRHFDIFKPKAHWMAKGCRELMAVSGNINNDVENSPYLDYALDWLENRKNSAGEDIIDIARAATENVEITGALDP